MFWARAIINKRLPSKSLVSASISGLRCEATTVATSAPTAPVAPATKFSEVKFKKEDISQVMLELPEFNMYEMKEPLPNPYEGVSLQRSILLNPPAPSLGAPQINFSKLENGLKIASVDRQGLCAHLGLFVNSGSRFEDSSNFGVSHMVSTMAYKSTAHLSHLRTVKTLEMLGSSYASTCTTGREEIVYSVDVMREYVPLVVPLMVGNVLFPRLLPWEVKSAQKEVKAAMAQLGADDIVNELLHKAAFFNNSLGHSTCISDRSSSYFTPETIRSFMLDHFAPERMVLVGVNVSHSELSKWAMRSFVDYNAIPMKKRNAPNAVFTGGAMVEQGASPFCHLAIGLESAAWGSKELAAVTLLQSVLGGGNAMSAKPGSGVTSRLYTQVCKQSPYVESCSAFNTSYSDTGLFGVYAVVQPEKAGEITTAICKTLGGLTSITKEELAKAKAMLKGSLCRQVDDGSTLMKDVGHQMLLSGSYTSPTEFAKTIDSLNESEVAAAAKKILSSKPALAAYGDTISVPHVSTIEAALKA